MIVTISTNGEFVNIKRKDPKDNSNSYVLVDSKKRVWFRCIDLDDFDIHNPNRHGFKTCFKADGIIRLSQSQIERVYKNDFESNEVDKFIEELPDKLREVLAGFGYDVVVNMLSTFDPIEAIKKALGGVDIPEDKPKPPAKPPTPKKKKPRAKLLPGGFEHDIGGVHVLLTPKQVEFMERMSEYPDFNGINGEFYSNNYLDELSDTMNAMSVGAIISTLREKGIITVQSLRIGGIKTSKFVYTELGKKIYKILSEGQVL